MVRGVIYEIQVMYGRTCGPRAGLLRSPLCGDRICLSSMTGNVTYAAAVI